MGVMDHVKGAFGALFPKVIELLKLVECKMQVDYNKECKKADRESMKKELLSMQSLRKEDEIEDELLDLLSGLFECKVDQNEVMESLQRELISLKSNLLSLMTDGEYIDASLDTSEDPRLAVNVWAKVRELSYDMEDVIDNFQVSLEGSKPIEGIDTLKDLMKKMTELDLGENIPEDARINDVSVRPASTTAIDPRVQAMYTETPHLVGMRGNLDSLKHLISHDPSVYEDRNMPSKVEPKTACVVGFGGLGKTTLVRTLYEEIEQEFSCKAFVKVGRNSNKKRVLMDILLALDREKKEKNYSMPDLNGFSEGQLINELHEFLCKKRYLIVIDDIWNEDSWKSIECAFRNERHLGSQVFTTTRRIDVAKACCSSSHGRLIYQLKPLSDEDSNSLFYTRVFSQEGGQCHDGFEQVSAAILKKCGGVPLAINTIASLLGSNREGIKPISEWNHLLESIGTGLTEGESVHEMNKILSLSYDDLSPELKNCLLYIAAFPENYQIKKDHLVSKWIGEGFVQRTNQEDSLFEVAENYFNILLNRSLIEPVKIDPEGKARSCRVHDMVLGFLCSLSSESNFVTVIDGTTRTTSSSETTIRRLSIQNSMATSKVFIPENMDGMVHVRSFTLSDSVQNWTFTKFYRLLCEAENHPTKMMNPLENFKVLRVLDLRDCSPWLAYHQDPLYVSCLLQLRYLGLRNTIFNIIPKDVGKLKYLQIVDLRNYNYIQELPSSIVELRELIYLRVDPKTRLPDDFGKLTSLEKLTHVMVNPDSAYVAKQLRYLINLRVLRITPEDMDENLAQEFVESLNKLLEIRSMELRDRSKDKIWRTPAFKSAEPTRQSLLGPGDCVRCMEESWEPSAHLQKFLADNTYCFRILPKWITESCNISSLSICLKEVRRDDIEILGRLLYLRYLNLTKEDKDNIYPAKQEEDFQFENDAFPVARELRIAGIVMLPAMFPKGAMPKVQTLEFHVRLEDFGNMNLEMAHLPALKKMKVIIWYKIDLQKVTNGAQGSFNENYIIVRNYVHEVVGAHMKDAEAALRAAADLHPNHHTTDIETRRYENNGDLGKNKVHILTWFLKTAEEESAEKRICFSDAEAFDVVVSRQKHITEMEDAEGCASLPPLPPTGEKERSPATAFREIMFTGHTTRDPAKSFELMTWIWNHDEDEAVEKQLKTWVSKIYRQLRTMWMKLFPSSPDSHTNPSDVEAVRVQTSRQPFYLTEVGEASRLPSLPQPYMFIPPPRSNEAGLPDDDEEISRRSMSMCKNDDKATMEKQLRSSEVEAVDIHTKHPPLRVTEIGESSGSSSQTPLHPVEVKAKSMWFMPLLVALATGDYAYSDAEAVDEAAAAEMQFRSSDAQAVNVQNSYRPLRLTEIDEADGLPSQPLPDPAPATWHDADEVADVREMSAKLKRC